MKKQVAVVEDILFKALLTGNPDIHKTSKKIVSTLFLYETPKDEKDEKTNPH